MQERLPPTPNPNPNCTRNPHPDLNPQECLPKATMLGVGFLAMVLAAAVCIILAQITISNNSTANSTPIDIMKCVVNMFQAFIKRT